MAEQEVAYREATLCIPIAVARALEPVEGNVKIVPGRPSKAELERRGLVPLGRHPDPDGPGLMVISDPKVDRENEAIRGRKAAAKKARDDNFRRNVSRKEPARAEGG